MEGYTFEVRVNLPDGINKSEFLACNLNPVVLLKDIRKTPPIDTGPAGPENNTEKVQRTHSISRSGESLKASKGSEKGKRKLSKLTPSVPALSSPERFKSMKRKRESWDPSVEYEIEKIVGYHRDKRKKMWYLVKWKNWSHDYDTFEPIANLTGCHYELMRYFETQRPTGNDLMVKENELEKGLKERSIYDKLLGPGCKAEDLEEFKRECPEAEQLLQTTDLDQLEGRIRKELGYIVRCLIGMYSHQDPGLFLRGQNYKLLLKLIHLRREQLKANLLFENLINAREKTRIAIENGVDLEVFPDINYIVELKVGKGVTLWQDPLLGCECPDGCNPRSQCCGRLADTAFAYNQKGRLRTEERIAIYECNGRCRCPQSCPNRVVQHGRQVQLCIFKTKACGWGVKALEKIPKGSFVCEYVGELIQDSEATVRDLEYYREHKSGYLFDLDFFTDPSLDMYCIDATKHGNVARFINHSCDPNLAVYPVWVDCLEPNLHRLAFFARKHIEKGEEIHFDYENLQEGTAENDPSQNNHGLRMLSDVRCQCKALNCRKWIFGSK